MGQWTYEDPGMGDMGVVRDDVVALRERLEVFASVRAGLEARLGELGLGWQGEASMAVRARFRHLIDGLAPLEAVCGNVGEASLVYVGGVDQIADEARRWIQIRDQATLRVGELAGGARYSRAVLAESVKADSGLASGGTGSSVGSVSSGAFPSDATVQARAGLDRVLAELAGQEQARDGAIEELRLLGERRDVCNRQYVEAVSWRPASSLPSGIYVSYVDAFAAGGVLVSVEDATALGALVFSGNATAAQKAQYSAWLALFGGDLIVMRAFVDGLSKAGVGGGQVAEFFLGTDPATAQARACWVNALNQHGGDPAFAGRMMRLLGVEGVQGIYAGIGDIAPPAISAGYVPETIGPTTSRDVFVNGLGAGIAGCFATASREPTAGTTWAQGTGGGKAIAGNRNTAAAVFYYAANGGYQVGDDALIAAGLSLTEGDTTSIGGPRGPWPGYVGGPHPEIINPDAMFWWTKAGAVSPSGAQAIMGNDQLFTHLISGPGGHGYRANAVHELITAAIIDQAMGDSPSGVAGARTASILADRLLDYVGGKPLNTPPGSVWEPAPNPVNDGLRETTAQVMAVFMKDLEYGSDSFAEVTRTPLPGEFPCGVSVNREILETLVGKVNEDLGARKTLIAGLSAYISSDMSQDFTTGESRTFTQQAREVTAFSRLVIDLLVDADITDVEMGGQSRAQVYAAVASGVKSYTSNPGITLIDMIAEGTLTASVDHDIETALRSGALARETEGQWTIGLILQAYAEQPTAKIPGTPEYEATQIINAIWPKDETGARIPMEDLTADQWKTLTEGLSGERWGDHKIGAGAETLNDLHKELKFGELLGGNRS